MPVERREQVTCFAIVRVNGQPEELDGRDGRRQPSMGGTSRVSREAQARICERLGVQFSGPTRPRGAIPRAYSPHRALQERGESSGDSERYSRAFEGMRVGTSS
jgi:hypothetical protein